LFSAPGTRWFAYPHVARCAVTGREHKALPGPVIDLIRDGVPRAELRAYGGKAVWSALCRTATSALQRGWTYPEWCAEMTATRSTLGRQARLERGRRDVGATRTVKTLHKAWTRAEHYLTEAPAPMTADDARTEIRTIRDNLDTANTWPENPIDKAALATALTIAGANGTNRPALPRRTIAAAVGITESQARRALERLERADYLRTDTRGQPAGPDARTRRATLYRLASGCRIPVPVNGSVGQRLSSVGQPTFRTPGHGSYVGQDKLAAAVAAFDELGISVSPSALAALVDAEHTEARKRLRVVSDD